MIKAFVKLELCLTSALQTFVDVFVDTLFQWSLMCTLVHISVHENYFSVQKFCFGVYEIKSKTYTRYLNCRCIAKKKVIGDFWKNFCSRNLIILEKL